MNEQDRAQQLVPADTPTAIPPPLPLVDQVADLRIQIEQLHKHIRVLHGVVFQMGEELNRQTGANWKPDVAEAALENTPGDAQDETPDAHVTADHSRRGRRAEAKFAEPRS